MKKIILITLTLFTLNAFAGIKGDEISTTIKDKIAQVTTLLSANAGKEQSVKNQIFAIFDPVFDYKLMARLSLGVKQFKSLTKEQQKVFTQKFEQKLKESFADKLKFYKNQTVKVADIKDVKNRKVLHTELIGTDKNYPIDYKFYKSKSGDWLIYDLDIISISVVQAYRNQFARVLNNKSFDELLVMLKNSEPAKQTKK